MNMNTDFETLEFLGELQREFEEATDNSAIVPAGERQCPICKNAMRVEEAFGVAMDVCNDHGIWLDRGEMRNIVHRLRSGERIKRQAAIREARRQGKTSGIAFGTLSLLFD